MVADRAGNESHLRRNRRRRAPCRQTRRHFDAIAPRYDLLNHLLSAGIDRRWRTRAIRTLQLSGRETLIDVCTGTADIALGIRPADVHWLMRYLGAITDTQIRAALDASGASPDERDRLERAFGGVVRSQGLFVEVIK